MYLQKHLLIVLLLCCIVKANAQQDLNNFTATRIIADKNETLAKTFASFLTVSFPDTAIVRQASERGLMNFKLKLPGDLDFFIQLQPVAVTAPDYRLELLTESGKVHRKSNPDHFYKGKLSGNDSSSVSATISDHYISFNIHNGLEEYYIEPLGKYLAKGKKGEYIVYKTSDLKQQTMLPCYQPEMQSLKGVKSTKKERLMSDTTIVLPVVLLADFMMYELFDRDISALETALLENLNQVQSLYTGFNLNGNTSSDEGSTNINFKAVKIVIATCNTCDVISNSTETNRTHIQLYEYLRVHPQYEGFSLIHLWTPRNLFLSNLQIGGIAGPGYLGYATSQTNCPYFTYSLAQFNKQNPAFMKLLMAHETGHNLGCSHDDEIKPSVKGFVMQNSAPVSATRFSRLSDFGGINYSSSLMIKNFILLRANCMMGYVPPSCGEVKDLSLHYLSATDSVYLNWKEGEKVFVRLKEVTIDSYVVIWEKELTSKSLRIGNLKACQNYEIEVSKVCGTEKGIASTLQFRTSSILLQKLELLPHTTLYDLKIRLHKGSKVSQTTRLLIDNVERKYQWNEQKGEITVFDLTSDNRNHKLEIKDTLSGIPCLFLIRYTAPDSRKNTTVLLKEDFNDCNLPQNWKDSITRQITTPIYNYFKWQVASRTVPNSSLQVGSFDSSCFLYYYANVSPMGCCGGRYFISPKIDVTGYKEINFSFDYILRTYQELNKGTSFFRAEVYNGKQWVTLLDKRNDIPRPRTLVYHNQWDSIPERMQFSLDAYKNKDLQVRFFVDDGTVYDEQNRLQILQYFIGLDNIKIDGIKETEPAPSFTIAPNPVRDMIRIHFQKPFIGKLNYILYDISGKIIESGSVNNYRIGTKSVSAGMYLLKLFDDQSSLGEATKIILTK